MSARGNRTGGFLGDPGGVFNVKDFGAKGDNRTDDSDAIQRAVDACILGPYLYGTVYFPGSEAYLIHRAIKVPRASQGAPSPLSRRWGTLLGCVCLRM